MTKTWYNTETGSSAVFDDDAILSDWPDFQEVAPVRSLTPAEARGERNLLLSKTDWWATSDRTLTLEQTQYRQALRDMPTHAAWPDLSQGDWPVPPAS